MQKNILILSFLLACAMSGKTYYAHLSDVWYPNEKERLLEVLGELREKSSKRFSSHPFRGKIKSLIVPHASYKYSGHVASSAYQAVAGQNINKVFILAPTHFCTFHGVALPTFSDYETSLGKCFVDEQCIDTLKREEHFHLYDAAYHPEHGIEVQIPFIQHYIKDAKIIPMIIGSITKDNAHDIALSLKECIDENSLVVISSDFTHYGQRFNYIPFTDFISARIYDLDAAIIRAIQEQDCDAFRHVRNVTGATVCGCNPISILLYLIEEGALGKVESSLLGYDTSAGNLRNPDHSVSYVSLVFQSCKKESDILTPYEQEQLLKIARFRLESTFRENVAVVPTVINKALMRCGGAFVSLYSMTGHGKKLRGCMGSVKNNKPIGQVVDEMTMSAALHDVRFNPVREREIDRMIISVSVLTKPKRVASYKDIVLGRDGVVLRIAGTFALYLPSVAMQQGWNVEELLSNLSKKAGLSANAWKHNQAELLTFQAQEFYER